MVVTPKALLQRVGDLVLNIDGCSISSFPKVRNLGIIIDSALSYQAYIISVSKSAVYHLRNISRLRTTLFDSIA